MSYFMIVAVGFLAALTLQFLFQMVQMKSFNKYYTRLREMGRVAIGKAKGGFHAGAIVMFAIDQNGIILDGCFMRGFTMFARFKDWDFFNGINVGTITKEDCATIGVSLRRAALNASSNYNTIMSGGEVLEKPGLLTRIGDKIYGVNKKKA